MRACIKRLGGSQAPRCLKEQQSRLQALVLLSKAIGQRDCNSRPALDDVSLSTTAQRHNGEIHGRQGYVRAGGRAVSARSNVGDPGLCATGATVA